jgi:hypothetical protein
MSDPSLDPERLVGAWRLLRWEIVWDDGSRAPELPYGTDAEGLLVYTADGWMSGVVSRRNRAPLSIGTLRTAPERERLEAFASYYHYAARWALRTSPSGGPQVVHSVRQSLNPGMVGTDQVRDIVFGDDGTLQLAGLERGRSGTMRIHRLHWRPATGGG